MAQTEIMADIVATGGISNKSFVMAMRSALAPYQSLPTDSKNFPKIGGVDTLIVKADLVSRQLNNKIFIHGKGISELNGQEGRTEIAGVESAPLPYAFRKIATDKEPGTEGNDGLINANMSMQTQVSWKTLSLNLCYDPDISVGNLLESIMKGANGVSLISDASEDLPRRQAENEDVSILATHVLSGLLRATQIEKRNCVGIGTGKNYGALLTMLARKVISPVVEYTDKQKQFFAEKNIMVLRESVYCSLFDKDNGVLLGCDRAQTMLQTGRIGMDAEATGFLRIDGVIHDTIIKAVPDYIWDMAKVLVCDTVEEATQFDNILGYVANADGFTLGRAEVGIKLYDAGRATQILPTYRWGVKCTRANACSLLVKANENLSDFTVLESFKTKAGIFTVPYNFKDHAKELGITTDYGDAGAIKAKVGASS